MFGIGPTEIIVVALIALLMFGNRVPSVMRNLGRGISEFKKGISNIQGEVRQIDESVSR